MSSLKYFQTPVVVKVNSAGARQRNNRNFQLSVANHGQSAWEGPTHRYWIKWIYSGPELIE